MIDLPDREKFWDDDYIGTVIEAWLNGVLRSRDEMDLASMVDALYTFLPESVHPAVAREYAYRIRDAAWGVTNE